MRSNGQALDLTAKYPSLQCIIGDLDSLDTIQGACREADIVINTGPDITHDDGIQAILSGLKKGAGRKGYYIHTSGAYLVIDTTEPGGLKDARVWDDVADIEELVSMPHTVTHAVTDEVSIHQSSYRGASSARQSTDPSPRSYAPHGPR